MKKKLMAAAILMAVLTCAIPVYATETTEEQELTNIENAGSTAVEADIVWEDSGDVSYIISIPEKIDFGTLQMPTDDSVAHPKKVTFEVSAVEVTGLDTTTSRIAVLMQDASTKSNVFQIMGASGTNNTKVLEYQVLSSAGVDITTGNPYNNGYLFSAFSAAGQSVSGTLSLEQNQLLTDTQVENWAGDYLGTINFYTAIAQINDYM